MRRSYRDKEKSIHQERVVFLASERWGGKMKAGQGGRNYLNRKKETEQNLTSCYCNLRAVIVKPHGMCDRKEVTY